MNLRTVTAVALVVLLVTPAPASAGFSGEPGLTVDVPENAVSVGEETRLTLRISNFGEVYPFGFPDEPSRNPETVRRLQDQVRTARDVRVTLRSGDAPVEVETGTLPLGVLEEATVRSATFDVDVAEDARPGTYRLPVRIEYEYDERVNNAGVVREQESASERFTVRLEVRPGSRFEVVAVESTVEAGATGEVDVTMENVGSATAREATVRLVAPDGGLGFEATNLGRASRYVGAWAPGERRTLTYPVSARDAEAGDSYAVRARVSYVDADSQPRVSRNVSIGVSPAPAPSFALADVRADLRVDDRGTVTGVVRNVGATAARNAVLVLAPPSEAVRPRTTEYALGTVAPGGRVAFGFPVDVARSATAGPEQLTLRVRYDVDDGEATSDALRRRVRVGEEREPFALAPVNATFPPDSEGNRLVVRLTNVGSEPRTDVVARLAPRPPFASSSSTAYAGRVEPGETVELAFSVTVEEDVAETTSTVLVNVTSDEPGRRDVVDGPYLVPVEVRRPGGTTSSAALLGAAVLVTLLVVGGGWWWFRR